MAVTEKVRLRILELRAEGLSYAKIAEEASVSKQTAVDIVKANIDQVTTLQAVEMEAFLDTSRINYRGRVKQLSDLHNRLREEIERRDLSDIPTDKLINLYLKTSDSLKGEVKTPCIRSTYEQEQDAAERSATEQWSL